MSEISWIENKSHPTSKADVSITIQKYRDNTKCTCIWFRNDCQLKITHGEHLSVGIDEGEKRICFKDGIVSGFKLSKSSSKNKYIRIPRVLEEYVGDYTLHMSAKGDFFYVKKGE